MKKKSLVLALAFAWMAINGSAEVVARLSQSKIVKTGDREVREAADRMKPGEVVEYSVVYTNTGKGPVRDVKAMLPVPTGMEYMPTTAAPKEVEVSVDGVNFGKFPLMRQEKDASGRMMEKPVPVSEYRYLRWTLGEMPGGASRSVSARMKLMNGSAAAATPAVAQK